MKYEIHIGDYAETRNGEVGFIQEVAFSDDPIRWCSLRIMRSQRDEILVYEGRENMIPDRFKRIGRYSFAAQDVVKPLDYTERFIRNAPLNDVNMIFMRKINELVAAVNAMRSAKDD